MDLNKLKTWLGIAGGAITIIAGGLETANTIDQMKNGTKLRQDQLTYLANDISNQVSANVIGTYDALGAAIVRASTEAISGDKGVN